MPSKKPTSLSAVLQVLCVPAENSILRKIVQQSVLITTLTAVNGAPWVFRNPAGGHITQTVQSSFKVNSGHLARYGALSGLGYAILPIESCQNEIKNGELEIVTLEYEPEDLVLYAFYSSRKHVAKKISMFVEHLKQNAKLNA